MPLSNVSVSDTFFTWLVRTNQLVVDRNNILEGNTAKTGTLTVAGYSGSISLNVAAGMIKGDGGLLTNVGPVNMTASTIRIAPGIANQITTNGAAGLTLTLGQTGIINVITSNSVTDTSTTNIAATGGVKTAYDVAVFGAGTANAANATINSVYSGGYLKATGLWANSPTLPVVVLQNNAATTNARVARISYAANTFNFERIDDAYTTILATPLRINIIDGTVTGIGNFVTPGSFISGTTNLQDKINTAFTQANTGYSTAQSAFGYANTTYTVAAAAFGAANTADTKAGLAWNQANTARTNSNTAYTTAAAAFGVANNANLVGTAANVRMQQFYSNDVNGERYLQSLAVEAQNFSSQEPYLSLLNTNSDSSYSRFVVTHDGAGEIRGTFRNNSFTVTREIYKLNNAGTFTINGEGQGYRGRLTVYGSIGGTYGPYGALSNQNPPTAYVSNPNLIGVSIWAEERIVGAEIDAVSDRRYKRNIKDLDSETSLEIIKSLQPKTYQWYNKEDIRIGFIAQELLTTKANTSVKFAYMPNTEILIETTDENGIVSPKDLEMTVNYDQLTTISISALKSLIKRVEELEKEINTLKAK